MHTTERSNFTPDELKDRYDVEYVDEDEWHTYSDRITRAVLASHLCSKDFARDDWILNAGAGVTTLGIDCCREVCLDLFTAPVEGRPHAVCANILQLPFKPRVFAAAVCVGEVLAYCDPSNAFSEFARVIKPGGRLIFDFGSTRSWRHFAKPSFGRAAVVLVSEYNGSDEKTWNYDPRYLLNRLNHFGFCVRAVYGAHSWSTIARRVGAGVKTALAVENGLRRILNPIRYSDTITVVTDLAEA